MKTEIYKREGYQFMAAAFEVSNGRGYGLAEEIYQECLEIELELRGISFRSKAELRCFYGEPRVEEAVYIPDLVVFGGLVVELKAVSDIAPEHEAQILNYMRISCQLVGYLLSFGHRGSLEWKRFILSEFICGAETGAPIGI